MKLQLSKEWFENRIQPDEDFEIGAGVPTGTSECTDKTSASDQVSINEFRTNEHRVGDLIKHNWSIWYWKDTSDIHQT